MFLTKQLGHLASLVWSVCVTKKKTNEHDTKEFNTHIHNKGQCIKNRSTYILITDNFSGKYRAE